MVFLVRVVSYRIVIYWSYTRDYSQPQRLAVQVVDVVLAVVQLGSHLVPAAEGKVAHLQQRRALHAVDAPDRLREIPPQPLAARGLKRLRKQPSNLFPVVYPCAEKTL